MIAANFLSCLYELSATCCLFYQILHAKSFVMTPAHVGEVLVCAARIHDLGFPRVKKNCRYKKDVNVLEEAERWQSLRIKEARLAAIHL